MTEQEVLSAIALSVRGDTANRDEVAKSYLKKAILRFGRMNDVGFNMDMVTFSTVSGQSTYDIGVDILPDNDEVWSIVELFRTDVERYKINIVGVDDFFDYAAGNTDTGEPQLATIHSQASILEFYPIPDSAYPMKAYVRKKIENFEDIPSSYHDILIDLANEDIKALDNPSLAMKKSEQGINELKGESLTKWTGSKITLARHLGDNTSRSGRVDSGNLRGA